MTTEPRKRIATRGFSRASWAVSPRLIASQELKRAHGDRLIMDKQAC